MIWNRIEEKKRTINGPLVAAVLRQLFEILTFVCSYIAVLFGITTNFIWYVQVDKIFVRYVITATTETAIRWQSVKPKCTRTGHVLNNSIHARTFCGRIEGNTNKRTAISVTALGELVRNRIPTWQLNFMKTNEIFVWSTCIRCPIQSHLSP